MSSDNLTIKHWAEEDRPREKLLTKGKSSLSNAELIAILIGSGTRDKSAVELSREILSFCDNDLHKIAQLGVKDLQQFRGIGEAKAISIVSALEIGRRRKDSETVKRPQIFASTQAYEYIRGDLLDQLHEEFWIILLKRNNEIIGKEAISKGGVAGTIVDAKILFKKALSHLASSIILVHNHPSGNLEPSKADLALTRKLKEAGKTLDIQVVDHLIIAGKRYMSFADEGLI